MTDPELVHRAEQAYLGALLARQGRAGTGTAVAGDAGPGGFVGLRPRDFTDPVHQAIYAALAGQAAARPRVLAGLYERFRGLLSRLVRTRARDASAYMAELPGMCPDPANLAAYAAMVADASQFRAGPAPAPGPRQAAAPQPRRGPAPGYRQAAENPRLASAGEWLEGTGPRHRRAGRGGADPRQADPRRAAPAADVQASRSHRTTDDLAPDVARLARALRPDARAVARGASGNARAPMPPENQPAPLDAEALQEEILADLMRRPADGRDTVSWLPDTVFSAGPNRSLYQLISIRLADGRPVDPLIIAWDASLLSDSGGTAGMPGTANIESLPAAALRVGTLDPAPGASATLARVLYADQVCTDTFGPDWPNEPGLIPIPPAPAGPSQRPGPGPSAAGQAVASTTEQPGPSTARAAEAETETETETARRTGAAPAAARHPVPALPRRVPSVPFRQPPVPGPAGPAPAQRM